MTNTAFSYALPCLLVLSTPSLAFSEPAAERRQVESQGSGADSGGIRRKLLWGTTIGAGVSLAGSIGAFFAASSRTNEFNKLRNPDGIPRCNSQGLNMGGDDCRALHDQRQTLATTSAVLLGTAAVLSLTSAVLYLTRPDGESERRRVATRFACAPALGLSASCSLTF